MHSHLFLIKVFTRAFLIIIIITVAGCGSSTSTAGSSGTDFSSLTYPQAAELYTEKGLDAAAVTGNLASAHNVFLIIDTDDATVATMQSGLDDFTEDLEAYTTLLVDINALEEIVLPDSSANLTASAIKFQSVDPSGVDSLNSLTDSMLAKKAECDALFALVPSLPSTPADFVKLTSAQQCVREAQLLAISNGFDAAIVSGAGGLVGGAAGGAAVIYLGGTVASGGGLLVVTVAGVVVSRVASYIWSTCQTSSSSNLVALLNLSADESCAFNAGSGNTDSSMTLQAVGTGTLQIFVEGCAPIILSGVTVSAGQAVTVTGTCEALDDDVDEDGVANANDASSTTSETAAATTCANIVSLVASNSPSDPGPTDAVTVTVNTLPPAASCAISYVMSGTDDYAQSATVTSSSAGQISFTIPASNQEGIVDTIAVTEAASGKASQITYVF